MLNDVESEAKEQVKRLKNVAAQLYIKDEHGNIKVKPGVTREQLLYALQVAEKVDQAFGDSNQALDEINNEINEHHRNVANTRVLMSEYKDVLPKWFLKIWGI